MTNTVGLVIEKRRRSGVADFFLRLFKEKPLGTVGAVIALFFAPVYFLRFLFPICSQLDRDHGT